MDRRQVFGWIGILLCLGVPVAWALTGGFSDSTWQITTMKADNYYVGAAQDVTGLLSGYVSATGTLTLPHLVVEGMPLNTYITGVAGGFSTLTQASPYTYIVSKVGATYYANSTTGGTNYSGSTFATILGSVNTALSNGGTIFIKSGLYNLIAITDLTSSNINVIGEGNTTIVSAFAGTFTYDAQLTFSGSRVTVSNIVFDGANNTKVGMMVKMTGSNCKFTNNILYRIYDYGFVFYTADNSICSNNVIYKAMYGIAASNVTTNLCENIIISNNIIYQCEQGAIKIKGARGCVIEGNVIDIGGWDGYVNCAGIIFNQDFGPAIDVTVSGNYIYDSTAAGTEACIHIDNMSTTPATKGLVINGNTFYNSNYGVFNDYVNVTISDNAITTPSSGNCIALQDDADGSIVVYNQLYGSTVRLNINAGAANVKVSGNIGYTSEARGTQAATIKVAATAVTHGLSFTPSAGDIMFIATTPLYNCTYAAITAYSSTTFTITTYDSAGVAKGAASVITFAWSADKS